MKRSAKLATLGLLMILGASLARAEMREFTDVKGRKLSAEFLGLQGAKADKASLRLATGKVVAVALERLSKEDQDYIADHPASKLSPVVLPENPLYAVTDWSARLKRQESYFIDSNGKRTITRPLKRILHGGFAASKDGAHAVVEGPYLGVIDTSGSAQFGVSRVGPPGLEAGSDAPVFMGRYGSGADSYVQYLRKDGKPFISAKFADARPFNSERAWVNLEASDRPVGGKGGIWTLIDYRGNLLHAFEDLEVQDFSEGRAGVALDTGGSQWAIIDIDAKVIAEGPFRRVGKFIDGSAVVDGRLMDRDGNWLMEEKGEWLIERRHENSESDAIVARRTTRSTSKPRYGILKRSTGEFLADIPDELYVDQGFFNGLAVVRNTRTHKFGFMNRIGQIEIEASFATAKRFSMGFAEVGVKDLHDRAVINLGGEVIWQPRKQATAPPPEAAPEAKPEAEEPAQE